ncbi:MAG: RHS repeat-associated core domain-containing protein, partial [Verrucomicrobiales bacterium]
AGRLAAHYEYDPFGNVTKTGGGDLALSNPWRFSTKAQDEVTGWNYYGFRYYVPDTGRCASRDPIGESGGLNLFGMAFNDPVNLVDPYGLNVYAVDGTNYNVQRHPEQRSNVYDFFLRSRRGGEESNYYGGVASRSSRIGPGDVTGYWGPGTEKLIMQVKADVCADYCDDQSIKINMVGWSRRAVVVQEVAKRLEEDGCCCSDGTLYKPVSVNFLGLYDSVERIPFRDYEDDRPGNIDHFHHAIRSDPGGIFKQQLTGDPNERPYTNNDGSQSNHGDIGTGGNHLDGTQGNASRAHAAMVRWARNSGVKIDTSGL